MGIKLPRQFGRRSHSGNRSGAGSGRARARSGSRFNTGQVLRCPLNSKMSAIGRKRTLADERTRSPVRAEMPLLSFGAFYVADVAIIRCAVLVDKPNVALLTTDPLGEHQLAPVALQRREVWRHGGDVASIKSAKAPRQALGPTSSETARGADTPGSSRSIPSGRCRSNASTGSRRSLRR